MLNAFVVMPIKEKGSPEFVHFRALYDDVIRPALQTAGYRPTRADDVQKTGAVTRDVIKRLAEAELVLADLSDLNPNVFYELGIRHALRGSGTIMMLDQARAQGLPFDVMPYRTILYASDVAGIAKLRSDLQALASAVSARPTDHRDSPVHDAVSTLPVDVLATAAGKADQAMAEQLAALRIRVREYEDRFGVSDAERPTEYASPLDTVLEALAKAERGELPTDLISQAEDAVRQHDSRTFLEHVRKLLAQPAVGLPTTNDYTRLAQGARALGLIEIAIAIYQAGTSVYPHDDSLRGSYLGELAHSQDPRARERARAELLAACGLARNNDAGVLIPEQLERRALTRIGIMLDAYHADHLYTEALHITTRLIERFPTSSVVARNHARALKNSGAPKDEAAGWYRRAVLCPDADDRSALWFGSHMFNDQRYVDAMEAYALAAMLDPDDAINFVDLLNAAALARRRQLIGGHSESPRPLPPALDTKFLDTVLLAGFSCPNITQRQQESLLRHARQADIATEAVERATAQLDGGPQALSFQQRYEFARDSYAALASRLTQEQPDKASD